MSIIGQKGLLKKIQSYTISTFPKSLLLVGEYGSEKCVIENQIQSQLGITSSRNITNYLTLEEIDNIMLNVTPTLYIIDATQIIEKEENVILKFIEEPPKNAFIVIECEDTSQVLPTIINRCQVWNMEKYSDEELLNFIQEEELKGDIQINPYWINIFRTPGKLINISKSKIDIDWCKKIIEKVRFSNFANVLTISNKIDFKGDDLSKINLNVLVDLLLYCAKENVINNPNDTLGYKIYDLTMQLKNDLYIKNIFTKELFDNYLTEMKLL